MTTEKLDQPSSKPQPVRSRLPPYFWDLLFVLVLPVACFVLDPFFFGAGASDRPAFNEPVQIAAYTCVGIFIVMFFLTYLSNGPIFLHDVLSGSLLAGSFFAILFGLLLLPFSLLGLIVLFGALGFIPFGTAWRYWRRFRALNPNMPRNFLALFAIIIGFIFSFLPSLMVQQYGQAAFDKIVLDIESRDPNVARVAISNMGKILFCGTYCQNEVSELFAAHRIALAEPEFDQLFKASTGVDYQRFLVEAD